MTELFEAALPDVELERVNETTVRLPTGELLRICAMPGCERTFTVNYPSDARRMCEDHKGQRVDGKVGRPPKGDRAPTNLNINLPGKPKTKDPALAAVEKRLSSFAGAVAVGVLLVGQSEIAALDAADIERGRAVWAQAGGELAEYEPWLKKLAAGGEMGERFGAWLKFLLATGAILLPITLRHGVLPAPIANLLQKMGESPEADVMGQVFAAMQHAAGADTTSNDQPAGAATAAA